MKQIIYLGLIIIILSACSKPKAYTPPTTVSIHYKDIAGSDLFTNGQNGYIKDSVRIYDWSNGVKTLIYLPTESYPYGYTFDSPQGYGPGVMSYVSYNQHVVNGYVTNIIHLKPSVDDTLICHVIPNTNLNYDMVWYNGKLIITTPFDVVK